MEVQFLGTSGRGITKTRNLPSFLVDKSLLFDCGEGCLKSLRILEIDLHSITNIFITHFHADHVLGLISIIYSMAFYEQIGKIPPIYIPEGMKSNLYSILDNTYTSPILEKFHYELEIHELIANHDDILKIAAKNKEYEIDWIKTAHNPLCYAYKINDTVVYSGDTYPIEEMIEFAKNVKILIHEASLSDDIFEIAKMTNHTTPEAAANIAKKSKVNILYLCHVPDLTSKEEIDFLKNAVLVFPNIRIAKDLDHISGL